MLGVSVSSLATETEAEIPKNLNRGSARPSSGGLKISRRHLDDSSGKSVTLVQGVQLRAKGDENGRAEVGRGGSVTLWQHEREDAQRFR